MKKAGFIIVLLLSLHFFWIVYIPQKINAQNLLVWAIFGYCFVRTLTKEGLLFRNAIILFFAGVFLNIISAFMNQGQSPVNTVLTFSYYYFILFYFFLHELELSRKYLENIIIIFAIIYSLIYIIQISMFPKMILSWNTLVAEDRGTIRLRIEGNGFLMLAYFLLLNRYLLKRRLPDIILALGFFVILIFGGFRTLTLAALLLSFIMFVILVPFSIKNYALLLVIGLLFFGLFQFKGISSILTNMISASEEQLNEGQKYIRLVQFDFFFKQFPKNITVFFLGSGLPGGNSSYAMLMEMYELRMQMYWTDLGLLGFYIIIGPVALAGVLWYAIKSIFIRLPKDSLYLKIYFAFLVIGSVTTMEIYRPGIFVVEAIALYLIDLIVFKEKESEQLSINQNETHMIDPNHKHL